MSFHYAHHRPLTPITPVHSPHPSNGSIRTRTPGQLSLHEYRKQLVTPSPPAIHGQKSIKKKRAASSLNKAERTPAESASPERYLSFHSLSTPPLTPSLPAPTNFPSQLSLPDAPPTRSGPVFPEFSHLTYAPSTRQQQLSLQHQPVVPKPSPSSSSQPLPPLPPSYLQPSTAANFLSSLFPFSHTSAKPSYASYQPIGDENLEEKTPPRARYVTFDETTILGSRSRSRKSREHEQEHDQSKQFLGQHQYSGARPRNTFPDLGDSRHSVGGQALKYVLKRAGIERKFEEEQKLEQKFGLLQDDSHAGFQAQ
jgi:hypothetical protein